MESKKDKLAKAKKRPTKEAKTKGSITEPITEIKIKKHIGRPAVYTPEALLDKINEYISIKLEERLQVNKLSGGKQVTIETVAPMTIQGFCAYSGLLRKIWYEYAQKDAYRDIISRAKDYFFDYKFKYAAVGVFDSNLVARELGIGDRFDVEGVNIPTTVEVTLKTGEGVNMQLPESEAEAEKKI